MFGLRLMGGDALMRRGAKLISFAAVAVGGLMLMAFTSSMVHVAVAEGISPIQNANAHPVYHNKYDFKKRDGPYTYTEVVPFPNATFINDTLTVTLTSTDITTEIVNPTSEAIANSTESTIFVPATSVPTVTFTNAYGGVPYGSFPTESAISSGDSVVFSSTDDLGYSTASVLETSIIVVSVTDYFTGTVTVEPSSPSEASDVTGGYTVTVTTTTVVFRGCDEGDEEFTGTETVTITPRVTSVDTTTVTTYSLALNATALDASIPYDTVTTTDYLTGIVTVTVYTSDASTQGETEAISASASSSDITTSVSEHLLTTTVMQTVIPIPQSSDDTTTCRESSTASTTADVQTSQMSTITVTISESTIVTATESLGYSVDNMHGNTTSGTTTMTADAVTASGIASTTCTDGTAAAGSYSAMMTMPDATNTPYPLTRTVFWSPSPGNDTRANMTGTAGTIHVPTMTDDSVVFETVSSAIIVHATPTDGTFSSGASSNKKLPRMGESNGTGYGYCTVMVVAISLVIQAFVI